jgi:hypothetical protein
MFVCELLRFRFLGSALLFHEGSERRWNNAFLRFCHDDSSVVIESAMAGADLRYGSRMPV